MVTPTSHNAPPDATLPDWPLNVSLLNMAWGTLASGLSVGAGKLCVDALRR